VIGLDTNVVVRYIAQDDVAQAKKATKLIESLSPESPGYIPLVTVVELVWVLESCYAQNRAEVVAVLDTLLRTKQLMVENVAVVSQALKIFAMGKADFADCLIARSALAANCTHTVTFDKAAANHAGMQLLE
jgi:predicted nucleic-acid-binding protein